MAFSVKLHINDIVGNNGKGFDFQYPHKSEVIKARLREVLGEERFNQAKINA
ncbi:MAG: hypothetical protein VXZ36_02650 [Pseudomonadota bacterium]|jgi:hypothetical protein|nr:hypothetical protein [Pseudomonadota bacterium]